MVCILQNCIHGDCDEPSTWLSYTATDYYHRQFMHTAKWDWNICWRQVPLRRNCTTTFPVVFLYNKRRSMVKHQMFVSSPIKGCKECATSLKVISHARAGILKLIIFLECHSLKFVIPWLSLSSNSCVPYFGWIHYGGTYPSWFKSLTWCRCLYFSRFILRFNNVVLPVIGVVINDSEAV